MEAVSNDVLGARTQQSPSKRRRTTYRGGTVCICPHCGRTFKRTEHVERHVLTHTKEKPCVRYCGADFARRDLLTRHQRISQHEDSTGDFNYGEAVDFRLND